MARFTFNGREVTVVNNHFSSKGGSSPILGVEQPFDERQEDPTVNGSLDERQAQAEAVNEFVEGLLADNPYAKVVVLGDLNEFEFVSPVSEILAENLTNLVDSLPEDERYSFIFQGNSQTLDHLFVDELLATDAQFEILHVNSEFAELDSRASDHDPLKATLDLDGLTLTEDGTLYIDGTAARDRINLSQNGGGLRVRASFLRGLGASDRGEAGIQVGQARLYDVDDVSQIKFTNIQSRDRLNIDRNLAVDVDVDISVDITNPAPRNQTIRTGAGNDTVSAGVGNDTLNGRRGNDYLFGGLGNDVIEGGGGDDTIHGAAGRNDVRGGGGNDSFIAAIKPSSGSRNINIIRDFTRGEDVLTIKAGGGINEFSDLDSNMDGILNRRDDAISRRRGNLLIDLDANNRIRLDDVASLDVNDVQFETFTLQLLHAADQEGGIEAIENAPQLQRCPQRFSWRV